MTTEPFVLYRFTDDEDGEPFPFDSEKAFSFGRTFGSDGFFADILDGQGKRIYVSTPVLGHHGLYRFEGDKTKKLKIVVRPYISKDSGKSPLAFLDAFKKFEKTLGKFIIDKSTKLFRREEPISQKRFDDSFVSCLQVDPDGQYPDSITIRVPDDKESDVDPNAVTFFDEEHTKLSLEQAKAAFEKRLDAEFVIKPQLVCFHTGKIRWTLQVVQVVFHDSTPSDRKTGPTAPDTALIRKRSPMEAYRDRYPLEEVPDAPPRKRHRATTGEDASE